MLDFLQYWIIIFKADNWYWYLTVKNIKMASVLFWCTGSWIFKITFKVIICLLCLFSKQRGISSKKVLIFTVGGSNENLSLFKRFILKMISCIPPTGNNHSLNTHCLVMSHNNIQSCQIKLVFRLTFLFKRATGVFS